MTLPMLASKRIPPQLNARVIERSRLIEHLGIQRAVGGRCVLLSAPPGYGKTTLLIQWLHQQMMRSAWLTLDPFDNDPFTFWTHLVFALTEYLPDEGHALRLLLRQAPFPLPRLLVIELLNALTNIPESLTLVLDDYHVIENPVIHESIAFSLSDTNEFLEQIAGINLDSATLAVLHTRTEG